MLVFMSKAESLVLFPVNPNFCYACFLLTHNLYFSFLSSVDFPSFLILDPTSVYFLFPTSKLLLFVFFPFLGISPLLLLLFVASSVYSHFGSHLWFLFPSLTFMSLFQYFCLVLQFSVCVSLPVFISCIFSLNPPFPLPLFAAPSGSRA